MQNSLAGCVQQVFKVITCLTSCDIDICLTLKGIKLIPKGNTFHLTREFCSCQLV